jgi:rod shape-determining protein MreD
MSLLFASVGAMITALVEVTVVPYLAVGHAVPHLVLVLGVVWTIAAGIDQGLVWAFIGGLLLDALLSRPLGASAFALLLAIGGAALLSRPLPQLRVLAPVVAVPVLSFVYSLLIALLTVGPRAALVTQDPISVLLPGVLYDTIVGVIVGPLAISLHDRRVTPERAEW